VLSQRVPDLDSLELLIAVATTGSLGRAGVARSISQPAVSARIQRMEQLVGLPLVQRSARGSALTAAGALVADWGRDVLSAAAVLDAGITSLRGGRDGRLRVAASLSIAEHLLPRWLVSLTARHPETAVSLDAVNTTEVVRQLLHGQTDLGFIEGPGLPDGLNGVVVACDQLLVVVAAGHPWSRRRTPLAAAELATTRLVHREPTSGTRAALEAALAAFVPLATPLLELSSTSAVRSAVIAGAGPAVLSSLALQDDLSSRRLVRVAVDGIDLTRDLRAVWPAGQRPTGPARDLLAIARRPGQRVPGS
jgi:DNA-binding transcriptional LysR family regulator